MVVFTLLLSIGFKIISRFDILYYNTLIDQISEDQVQKFFSLQNKLKWLSYLITSIFLIVKISIIAAILDIGCFFFDKKITYRRLFNIVIKAEFIFLGVIVSKTIWFYVFQQEYTLEDLQYFYPFSVLNIIGYQGVQSWYIYPLQLLNLFELAYWITLAYLLGKELKIATKKGLKIVASSYGIGLVIWVVAVMFLTLNIS